MDNNYDEDLNKNPFFEELKSLHNDLIEKVIADGWLICIPKKSSIFGMIITIDDIIKHILVPNDELPETHFTNLIGDEIRIFQQNNERFLVFKTDSYKEQISILFDETFYNKNFIKYKVLCIEKPLQGILTANILNNQIQNIDYNFNITSLNDSIKFLQLECFKNENFNYLDKTVYDLNIYLSKLKLKESKIDYVLKEKHFELIIERMNHSFKKCSNKFVLNDKYKYLLNEERFLKQLKLSIETYLQNGVYFELFDWLKTYASYDDINMNKFICNLTDINVLNLLTCALNDSLKGIICSASIQLSKIHQHQNCLEKIVCVKLALKLINDNFQSKKDCVYLPTVDDLLPIFVFLIIKTHLPNWHAHLLFLKHFRYELAHTDEISYVITTLEASLAYIKSLMTNFDQYSIVYYNQDVAMSKIFEAIRFGDLETVCKLIDEKLIVLDKLCHPLCTCQKCVSMLNSSKTVDLKDTSRGLTCLHVATLYNRCEIVLTLLDKYSADINVMDNMNNTPLHYAASKGYSKLVNILLNREHHNQYKNNIALYNVPNGLIKKDFKNEKDVRWPNDNKKIVKVGLKNNNICDIYLVNNEKNTALHLASNNGHLDCVQMLLSYKNDIIDMVNSNGDTALHLASKWGYSNVVEEILKYNVDVQIENKKKLTSIQLAHNILILDILTKHQLEINKDVKTTVISDEEFSNSDCFVNSEAIFNNVDYICCSSKFLRKVDCLLNAVTYGDINLMCFYLGIKSPNEDVTICTNLRINEQTDCTKHPLCTCAYCIGQNKQSTHALNINVSNLDGVTCLHLACKHGWCDIFNILLENGAQLDVQTRHKKQTPLQLACQNKRHTIVRILIKYLTQEQINYQDADGITALMHACLVGDSTIAEILFNSSNANPFIKNNVGVSALQLAEQRSMYGLLEMFDKFRIK